MSMAIRTSMAIRIIRIRTSKQDHNGVALFKEALEIGIQKKAHVQLWV